MDVAVVSIPAAEVSLTGGLEAMLLPPTEVGRGVEAGGGAVVADDILRWVDSGA